MKNSLIPLTLILGLASVPTFAQNENNSADLPIIVGQDVSSSKTATSAPVTPVSNTNTEVTQPDVILLADYLQLTDSQIERLDRIYEEYASERIKQENKMDVWQGELEKAQAPATLDEEKASRLMRGLGNAQKKVADKFVATRSQALEILTKRQRNQLQTLINDKNSKVRTDKWFQLLYMPTADFWRLPLAPESQQRVSYKKPRKRSAGISNYGVYGGYNYGGLDYGVYAGYRQNGVGVHAGIGRGGPAVDLSVGNFSVGSLLRLFR